MKRFPMWAFFGVVLLSAVAGAALYPAADRTAQAVCEGDGTEQLDTLFSVSPPPQNLALEGTAPFQVTITFEDRTILSTPGLTMSFTWGDGASTPVAIVPCGDDKYSWPVQVLSHTYTTPGQYAVQWHLSAQVIQPIDSLAVIVTVSAAQATAVPATPTPLPPTPAPATPTAAGQASPSPAAGSTETPEASATPSPATTATAAASSTPVTATPTPTRTPTAAPAPAGAAASPPPAPPTEPGRPELVRDVPSVQDISADPGVVATNLVLAGVTIWVFFSSVLFNQTLQSHRSEVTGWFRGVRKPFEKVRAPGWKLPRARWVTTAAVLLGTAVIYEFLEPGIGWNEASVILFFSVLIGVGVVGLAFSGIEALARERTPGVEATVRAFPLSLPVAVASVLASRLLDLQPGVIYGFAASCVVLTDAASDARREGRTLAVPVTACLALSVGCWLLVGPAREVPVGWLSHFLEATAVVVFIGGLEGLLINLLPLDVMDGAKIFRWNRIVWGLLLAVSAFLFWHVLLNTERAYFQSLREASSLSVLVGFLLYTAAGVGLWSFFRLRGERGTAGAA